jgi:hypothetical protein
VDALRTLGYRSLNGATNPIFSEEPRGQCALRVALVAGTQIRGARIQIDEVFLDEPPLFRGELIARAGRANRGRDFRFQRFERHGWCRCRRCWLRGLAPRPFALSTAWHLIV